MQNFVGSKGILCNRELCIHIYEQKRVQKYYKFSITIHAFNRTEYNSRQIFDIAILLYEAPFVINFYRCSDRLALSHTFIEIWECNFRIMLQYSINYSSHSYTKCKYWLCRSVTRNINYVLKIENEDYCKNFQMFTNIFH